MRKPIALMLAALIVLPPLAAAASSPREGDDGANVLVRLVLRDGDRERPIQALVLDGQRVRTTTGWRVPIVERVVDSNDGGQMASIQYQDIGMGVTLLVRIVGAGRIRISGEVDLGRIQEGEPTRAEAVDAPTVASFRHVFDVMLADGVSTTLAEVPKPDSGSSTLSITADIQD